MMHLVDVRGHPEQRQYTVEAWPEPDVSVLDHAVRRLQQALDHDGLHRDTEKPDRDDRKQKPPHSLDRMRSVRRRDVDELVAVMHPMEAPHRRPRMHGPMRQIADG